MASQQLEVEGDQPKKKKKTINKIIKKYWDFNDLSIDMVITGHYGIVWFI